MTDGIFYLIVAYVAFNFLQTIFWGLHVVLFSRRANLEIKRLRLDWDITSSIPQKRTTNYWVEEYRLREWRQRRDMKYMEKHMEQEIKETLMK